MAALFMRRLYSDSFEKQVEGFPVRASLRMERGCVADQPQRVADSMASEQF
jgi:hypothetical protein